MAASHALKHMPAPSRHVLPHGARLRRRDDVGPLGVVAAIGAIVFVLWADHAFAAGAPKSLKVEETADYDVVLTVDAKDAPTFQVFQVPGHKSFVVELPGLALDPNALEKSGKNVLLDEARVENAKNGPGRVVLAFVDEVDYDANTKGNELKILFKHAGDKQRLLELHEKRVAEAEQKRLAALDEKKKADEAEQAAKADAERRAREDELKRQAELDQKRLIEEAKKAEIEKKRADEEAKRVAAEEAKKKAEEERKAAIEKKRADDEAKRVAAEEAKKRAEEERKAAIEKKRADEEAKRVAAEEAKKRAEDEKRAVEEAKKRADEEAKKAAEEKKRAEAEEKRRVEEQKRADEEAKKKADEDQKRAAEEAKKRADDEKKAAEARAAEEKRVAEEQKKAEEQKRIEEQKRAEEQKKLDEQKRIEEQKKLDEQKRIAEEQKKLDEQKRVEEQKRIEEQKKLDEQKRLDEQRRIEEQKRVEEHRRLDEQRRIEEQKRAEREKKAAEAAAKKAETVAMKKKPAKSGPSTISAAPATGDYGFGGSIDLTPSARYQRYTPPANDDAFGGNDDDGDALDESNGRSVLSQVTVQRTQGGSKVGVRVDGGAKYNVTRRGRNHVVLTLFDTRAANLEVRRILDASGLDTSVVRVLPNVEEDARYRVELTVELREQAPVRVGQEGGMLWLLVGDG